MNIIREVSRGKTFERIETVFVTKDGREIYVEGSVNGRFIDGKFFSTRSIFRDITERKKMEERLRALGRRLRDIAMNLGDVIWEVDTNWNYVYVAGKARQMLGYAPKELIGRNFFDFLHPEEAIKVASVFDDFSSQKRPIVDFESRVVSRDGKELHVTINARPVLSKEGDLIGYRGIIRDITYQKTIEHRLKESEELFRTLVESSPVGIYIYDPFENRFIYANPAIRKELGLDEIDVKNVDVLQHVSPEFRENLKKRIRDRLEGKEVPGSCEVEVVLPDGQRRWIELYTSVVRYKGKPSMLATAIDLTERKRLEEELKEKEEKYRTIFDGSPEAIVVLDQNGIITEVNGRVEEWLGYKKEEVVGKNLLSLSVISEKGKEEVIRNFKERFQGKEIPPYDLHFIKKNGEILIGRVQGALVMDEENQVKMIIAMITDVTEQRRYEERLIESEERFRTISASAWDAIIILDDEGRICYWNKAAERIFGYKPEEILGKDLHKVLAPEKFRRGYEKGMNEFRRTGKGPVIGKTIEINALRRDGTEFPAELSLSSVKIRGRWHAVGIIRDITERKQMEKKLREKIEELERYKRLTVGRELRMIELKKRIRELEEELAMVRRKNE